MDWFARWARDRPDAPFLIDGPEVLDYAAALARISGIAGGLRGRYSHGARLGVVMRPDIPHLVVAMAVPLAGMVLVPLPVAGSDDERRRLADLAGVDDVVGPGDTEDGSPLPAVPDESVTAAAIFTSGTSGGPRAVRLTWSNIEASSAASASHIDHRSDDRWLAVLPLHHVGGLSILWRSARQGSAAVLAGRFDAATVAGLLAAGAVTLGSFVSPMLERLADTGLERVPGFRLGLVGGGPASERALSVGGMRLLATYGMTETASQVATADPAEPRSDRLVVLEGARVTISGDGRIVVDGPMVSPGDLDAPDRGGPLLTGDLGRFHGNRLEVMGRADDVIVTGGENVMPERVERIAATLSGAGEVAVVGLTDDRWGMIVAAAFTGPAEPDELQDALQGHLAPHEIPRRWVRVTAIPKRGIGKVDRQAVGALFD
ncbi:MAG: AMP-binding protein [Acidimicrobiia bacterium]